jgi:hypothetical protein
MRRRFRVACGVKTKGRENRVFRGPPTENARTAFLVFDDDDEGGCGC